MTWQDSVTGEETVVGEQPMSHEDRRKLIETPIRFTESGGKTHGGAYRITDAQDEEVRRRYMRWLERQKTMDQFEG